MVVFVVFIGNSFGYFKKRIEGTKITFNVGTLSYELDCIDLTNCEITIPANSSEVFNVNITSLNGIETKYELYYEIVDSTNVSNLLKGGHIPEEETLTYLIDKNDTKSIPLVLNNSGDTSITVKLGVLPSLKSDSAKLTEEQISLNKEAYQKYYVYDYTGNYKTFIAPVDGTYQLEAWGAAGAGDTNYPGGRGAYTSGNIFLNQNQKLYIYVGQSSTSTTDSVFNNGGLTRYHSYGNISGYNYAGGGSTDIRLIEGDWNNFDSIKSRLMVAAGGGGAQTYYGSFPGGAAGGLIGYDGGNIGTNGKAATGATQTSGGSNGLGSNTTGALEINTFGKVTYIDGETALGGNGYYAGGNGPHGASTVGSGAGGSSFISGHAGCDAIDEGTTESSIIHTGQANHYSGYVFTDTIMIDGAGYNWTTEKGSKIGMPTTNKLANMVGNSSNGYARITYFGKDTYTINYNSNGGSGTMDDSEVLEYEDFILPKNSFTKEGYSFIGWSLSPDSKEVVYKDLDKVSSLTNKNEEITLYAQWTKNHTLTINPNGGNYNGSTPNTTISIIDGSYTHLSIPTRAGYDFTGYTVSGNGNYVGTSSTPTYSSNYTKTEKEDTNGNYTNFKYSGTNQFSGNTWFAIDYPSYSYTSGSNYKIDFKVRLNEINGTYLGFRHAAFSNDYATSGLKVINAGSDSALGQWSELTFDRIFTGTTIEQNSASYTIAPRFEIYTGNLINSNVIIDFDIKDVVIKDVTTDKIVQASIPTYYSKTGDATLTANWKVKIPTVTFNANGGSVSTSSKTVTYGSTYGDLPTPTRAGYEFIGWFDEKYKDNPLNYYADAYSDLYKAYGYDATKLYNHWVNNGKSEGRRVSQYLSTDKVTKTSNHTVYAGWRVNTVNLLAQFGSSWTCIEATGANEWGNTFSTTKVIIQSGSSECNYAKYTWKSPSFNISNHNTLALTYARYRAEGYTGTVKLVHSGGTITLGNGSNNISNLTGTAYLTVTTENAWLGTPPNYAADASIIITQIQLQ